MAKYKKNDNGLFAYLKAISHTGQSIEDMTKYDAFMINRFLSYSYDCAIIANEMNMHSDIPKDIQFEFLKSMIPKRKRFEKFQRKSVINNIELVKSYYNYSDDKAKEVLNFITEDELKRIKLRMKKGGRKNE